MQNQCRKKNVQKTQKLKCIKRANKIRQRPNCPLKTCKKTRLTIMQKKKANIFRQTKSKTKAITHVMVFIPLHVLCFIYMFYLPFDCLFFCVVCVVFSCVVHFLCISLDKRTQELSKSYANESQTNRKQKSINKTKTQQYCKNKHTQKGGV